LGCRELREGQGGWEDDGHPVTLGGAFSGSGFYSLWILSAGELLRPGLPLCPRWDGAVGRDGEPGCISERSPGWGYSLPPQHRVDSPSRGQAGVSLPPLPTVGLKHPKSGGPAPPCPPLRAPLAIPKTGRAASGRPWSGSTIPGCPVAPPPTPGAQPWALRSHAPGWGEPRRAGHGPGKPGEGSGCC